ncbi:hypothetical protein K502DRAFT_324586 [Neoconidiobolus thromboides FSU 785]|nr:hypothetical protein K502DRAFT_324586 [Neoconidiobolus thromboides FSU 785]
MNPSNIKEGPLSNKRRLDINNKLKENVAENNNPDMIMIKKSKYELITNTSSSSSSFQASSPFNNLPDPVWDRLIQYLPFNTMVQASQVSKNWRHQINPYLWKKPSYQWYLKIIKENSFIKNITHYQSNIRNIDCINIEPRLLSKAVGLCHNLEALALNCSMPIVWKDQELVEVLSHQHLRYKLKHLAIFNLNLEFSKWKELSEIICFMRNLIFLTLPPNFPYNTAFKNLPTSLKFLNCSLDNESYLNLLSLDLNNFIGLTMNFNIYLNISLENLLLKLKKLTTLSLEGNGYISKLNHLINPKLLTGLKININTNKEDLLILLRKCRNLVHVEFCNICCDDRTIKLLLRHNFNLKVLKVINTSITTSGIASIFKSKAKIQQLELQCHHENCGPYNLELDKCEFLYQLKELNINLTLYLSIKILKALKFMKSLVNFQFLLSFNQLGNIDCHSIFTPSLPYLAFFPITIQLDYLMNNWPTYFKFQCYTLTKFHIQLKGNELFMKLYKKRMIELFKLALKVSPCILKPMLLYQEEIVYPEF